MSTNTSNTEQITATVKEAAVELTALLGLPVSNYGVYRLLNDGALEGRWHKGRRLVVRSSLRDYVENLPTERPTGAA